jgi:ATP-binding cassette subfamily B (MDR/TAP) protein 1
MFLLLDRIPLINGLEPIGDVPQSGTSEAFDVGSLEMRNVSFFYPFRPDVQVLKNLSFTVNSGDSVGFVGPSGGGKSTVMALMQRFYDPQEGDVLVGAVAKKPLREINIRWWRRQIGFVGQEPILFDGTVMQNVKYGLDDDETVTAGRLDECKAMSNLHFLDKAQGWETQVGPRGGRLSGGQKQRVAICRALIRNPPIMLLDEATSALDSQSEKVVSVALEAARQGRTSFAIAHRLSTIRDCDTIMVIGEGRVLERGSHMELMELQGVYQKLQVQSHSSDQ